jgi:hypothetical protein
MGVEVVLHQDDLARCGKVRVGQSFKRLSIVQRGTAESDMLRKRQVFLA